MQLTATLPIVAALMASSVNAIGGSPPPKVKPHVVEGFAWKDPFAGDAIAAYEPACEATKKFDIMEFTLLNLMEKPPKGLRPWSKGLKTLFSTREYPGSWAGYDRHGNDRAILKMEYADIPLAARRWIEQEERTGGPGKGLFGVFEKPQNENDTIAETVSIPDDADSVDRSLDKDRVAIFAPGALYYALPLWAAEDSNCKDDLLDLAKYQPEPADGNVVGWMSHTAPKDRVAQFTVKVQSLKGKTASKDEL